MPIYRASGSASESAGVQTSEVCAGPRALCSSAVEWRMAEGKPLRFTGSPVFMGCCRRARGRAHLNTAKLSPTLPQDPLSSSSAAAHPQALCSLPNTGFKPAAASLPERLPTNGAGISL